MAVEVAGIAAFMGALGATAGDDGFFVGGRFVGGTWNDTPQGHFADFALSV